MGVTTWTFQDSYEGWIFEDVSIEFWNPPGTATRSHIAGAIRNTVSYPASGVDVGAASRAYIPGTISVVAVAGDKIELDRSASSDAGAYGTEIHAVYSDETDDFAFSQAAGSFTLTLNLIAGKTLVDIYMTASISRSGAGGGRTSSADYEEIRLTTSNPLTPTAGKLRTPDAYIAEQSDGGGGVQGGDGGGSGGNLADISDDGLYIYIALFNNLGHPTLIRMSTQLDADGSVVFEPGAGGRIGVQCGRHNDSDVWVAGVFDGTNTVEKSENAGSSWTVKDDGTFGTIRTFLVGPDSDDRILLFDGDNYDLIETTDDGDSWTTVNSATGVLLNSLARFSVNPEEVASVNEAGAVNGVFYSVNGGTGLEDIQSGVYPNADGTKTVV